MSAPLPRCARFANRKELCIPNQREYDFAVGIESVFREPDRPARGGESRTHAADTVPGLTSEGQAQLPRTIGKVRWVFNLLTERYKGSRKEMDTGNSCWLYRTHSEADLDEPLNALSDAWEL